MTLELDVPGWRGALAGQHVDVRLTAEDGYSTQRSYSLASPGTMGLPGVPPDPAAARQPDRAHRAGGRRRRGVPVPHRGPAGGRRDRAPRTRRALVRLAACRPAPRAAHRRRVRPGAAHVDAAHATAGREHGAVPAGRLGAHPDGRDLRRRARGPRRRRRDHPRVDPPRAPTAGPAASAGSTPPCWRPSASRPTSARTCSCAGRRRSSSPSPTPWSTSATTRSASAPNGSGRPARRTTDGPGAAGSVRGSVLVSRCSAGPRPRR